MNDMPRTTGSSLRGKGLIVAAASLLLIDIFLMFYIPVEQCMARTSGTRRGRFVEQYLCSHTLLDDGLPGIARFAVMWAPPVILAYAWITARRRAGSPA